MFFFNRQYKNNIIVQDSALELVDFMEYGYSNDFFDKEEQSKGLKNSLEIEIYKKSYRG